MNQDYVRKKAAEALAATSGNRREAALLLRVWAEADGKLKSAITAPFLPNLCALAVQRAASTGGTGRRQARRAASSSPDDAANLLAAIGSRASETMTGTRGRSAPPPPASSARHKQAVATLAAAFRSREPKG